MEHNPWFLRMGQILNARQSRTIALTGSVYDLFFLSRKEEEKADPEERYVSLLNSLLSSWDTPALGGLIKVVYELNGPVRFLHDEDMPADTDYCAMCGHDWCAIRISKEIQQFAAGKHEGYQPDRESTRASAPTDEQRELLARRGKQKPACHSDNLPDEKEARRVQRKCATLRSERQSDAAGGER